MKKRDIDAIYNARRDIVQNEKKIIEARARNDIRRILELRRKNAEIRREILKKYGIEL